MRFKTFSGYVCEPHPDPPLTPLQEDEEDTRRALAESGVAEQVEIDENGGKLLALLARLISQAFTLGSWATGKLRGNWILRGGLSSE